MAVKIIAFTFFFSLALHLSSLCVGAYQEYANINPSGISIDSSKGGLDWHRLSERLAGKGYLAMSLTLEDTLLNYLLPPVTTTGSSFTIFAPKDKAFFSLKYGQPPITLLKYQVAIGKIDKESWDKSSPHPILASKVDSLLPGHPLVVTILPNNPSGGFDSVNDVKITDWNLYTDERITIHGVEDFFDPAFQTLLYPSFEDVNTSSNTDVVDTTSFFWILATPVANLPFTAVLLMVGAILALLASLVTCGYCCGLISPNYEYAPVPSTGPLV